MEYLEGPNLFDYFSNYIEKNKRQMPIPDILAISKQIINCLKVNNRLIQVIHLLKGSYHGYLKLSDLVYHRGTLKILNTGYLETENNPEDFKEPNLIPE